MVSTQFDADAFCKAFESMNHTVVNEYETYLQPPQYSVACDNYDLERGDLVSHLNCMHVRLEPNVLHQDYIVPQALINLVCRECLPSPTTAASITPREIKYHHFCTILPVTTYVSRSFLISYDLDNDKDRDLSKKELVLSTENVCNFWFYSVGEKEGTSGKSIRVYQDEAYANLDKFMSRSKGDRAATCHRLKANELRKYLSRISQPLKKVNNDKGDVRNQNYAYTLAELKSRGFYNVYLKDNQTLYELDLVEKARRTVSSDKKC